MTKSTQDLIKEYNELDRNKLKNISGLQSSRYESRQKRINTIVDELEKRADNGDTQADRFFDRSYPPVL